MLQSTDTAERVNSRITIDDIHKRRAAAGPFLAGVGAVGNSDMFKGSPDGKPLAKRWANHLSFESNLRHPSKIKQATGLITAPDMISLAGGLPSSEYFPFAELSFKACSPEFWSAEKTVVLKEEETLVATIGKDDTKIGASEYDLSIALNYGQATGSLQLTRFITEHTQLVFNPPYADWQICQTVGSTAALEQIARMLCDRARRDSVLTDEYSFSTALDTFRPQGIKLFGVATDAQGLLPSSLEAILASWDEKVRAARKPHVLYTVPTGQNPTGATQTTERRRQIYAICQKHDLLIIEDEPYYFIQMDSPAGSVSSTSASTKSLDDFLSSLVPTYLSLDIDGRVIRMDSFSKVLVPGSRLGWITASAEMVQKFVQTSEVANQGPSGFSQVLLWKLLDQTWGHEGYLRWLMNLPREYSLRRDALLAACESYLPRSIVSWEIPMAGMFLWLKIDPSKHPDYPKRQIEDIEEEIAKYAVNNGVSCARGSWFRTEPGTEKDFIYFRTTFASATEKAMATAIQRLSKAIGLSFSL